MVIVGARSLLERLRPIVASSSSPFDKLMVNYSNGVPTSIKLYSCPLDNPAFSYQKLEEEETTHSYSMLEHPRIVFMAVLKGCSN
jgi:hypothetical protein